VEAWDSEGWLFAGAADLAEVMLAGLAAATVGDLAAATVADTGNLLCKSTMAAKLRCRVAPQRKAVSSPRNHSHSVDPGKPLVSADGRTYSYTIPAETWGVVVATRGQKEAAGFAVPAMRGCNLPSHPTPPYAPATQVEVSSERLTAQWNLGAWHLLRHSVKDSQGKWRFTDFPYGILASETYMILRALDLQGMHTEAADGLVKLRAMQGAARLDVMYGR
jgi:hypothetical protein